MGSLPNLNELGREQRNCQYRLGSYLGQSHHGPTLLTYEEKNKILHRHSGYCRNVKLKNNTPASIYDDFMLEQMAAYSPISSRSTRNLSHIRRRDSMNSSIGATSVRRLIAVVRNTSSRCGPIYSRKILIKNLIALCVSHTLVTSTFLPFSALQGSVSAWIKPITNDLVGVDINIGSILLTIMHVFASISSVFGPSIVQKIGANGILVVFYVTMTLFYVLHFFPLLYVLVPGYVLLGLIWGPVSIARVTFLMNLTNKMSYVFAEDDEESKLLRRTCLMRRLSRAFQAAHDFGFIFGSLLTALVVTYTFSFAAQVQHGPPSLSNVSEANCSYANCTNFGTKNYEIYLDGIFDVDELGDRLCGAQACPTNFPLSFNTSDEQVLTKGVVTALVGIYVGFSALAFVCVACGLDKIKMFVNQDPLERSEGLAAIRAVKESFGDVRLKLAAPLAFFIGLEQSFMYSDFSKSYVVCTLGVHRLNFVFLCMGLLQSVAACTLSMLLRSIRRYYVIAVGFAFHICLLMVQILWKPIGDDPALFYVISAAWGVCNAIWEMLNFTLLTGLYMDNWEAAFANSSFFKFLGHAFAYGFHGILCNWLKLYLLAFFMIIAVLPYGWLEIKLENLRKIKNITRL